MKQQQSKILLLLLMVVQYIRCQQCLSLAGSKACPLFGQVSIQVGDSASRLWLTNVTSIEEFDDQLFNQINTTAYWSQELGYAISIVPSYATSMACAVVAFDSKSSDCNSKTRPLCQSTCISFWTSIQSNLNDTDDSAQQCTTDPALNGTFDDCISGSKNECDNLCNFQQTDLQTISLSVIVGVTVLILIICGLVLTHICRKRHMVHQAPATKTASFVPAVCSVDDINLQNVKSHVQICSIEQQFARASFSFTPSDRPDEIKLLKDDILQMYYCFDDGWAFGDNFFSGCRGLFPLSFVTRLSPREAQELLSEEGKMMSRSLTL